MARYSKQKSRMNRDEHPASVPILKTMEQMADELEENMETIAKICSAIEKEGTHDAEAIFHFMNPE